MKAEATKEKRIMATKFNTIMYGTLEDLDSILDREEMDEQELRAALQRVLAEVRSINRKLEIRNG